MSDPFLANLLLVIGVGVAVSAWLLFYTDWFAHFSVLLALSGVFTWLGVVSKLLSEDRIKELQQRLDAAVFARSAWRGYLVAAVIALAAAASFVGTIDVRSVGDQSERLVWFDYNPADTAGGDRLAPSERLREPRFTTFWRPTQARVKVGGYPSTIVTVWPWRRSQVYVPATLLLANPVILLRPSKDLATFNAGLKLVVSSGGRTRERPFDGHAVWIGCEDDVQIPLQRLEEWRLANDSAALLARWQTPRAIDLPLTHGATVQVRLLNEDGSEYVGRTIAARRPARPQDFPQVEDLDVPR